MIEYGDARDEMFSLFDKAWDENACHIVGYTPEVLYQGVWRKGIPEGNKYWCRVSLQTVIERQSALSTCSGKPGQRKYTTAGHVFVQLFCPMSDATSFDKGQKLAKIARNAFRGKSTPGGVWFRDVWINELEPENTATRFNIVAEFEYSEVG